MISWELAVPVRWSRQIWNEGGWSGLWTLNNAKYLNRIKLASYQLEAEDALWGFDSLPTLKNLLQQWILLSPATYFLLHSSPKYQKIHCHNYHVSLKTTVYFSSFFRPTSYLGLCPARPACQCPTRQLSRRIQAHFSNVRSTQVSLDLCGISVGAWWKLVASSETLSWRERVKTCHSLSSNVRTRCEGVLRLSIKYATFPSVL